MNPLASFELDYNSGLPVWIQVKNRIAYLIGSGEYKATSFPRCARWPSTSISATTP